MTMFAKKVGIEGREDMLQNQWPSQVLFLRLNKNIQVLSFKKKKQNLLQTVQISDEGRDK